MNDGGEATLTNVDFVSNRPYGIRNIHGGRLSYQNGSMNGNAGPFYNSESEATLSHVELNGNWPTGAVNSGEARTVLKMLDSA